jgi:predicted nucleic acid-binding protein
MRVRLETEAVQLIVSHARANDVSLVVSPVHNVEVSAIPDHTEREYLVSLLNQIGQRLSFDLNDVRRRAETLVAQGLGPADAAHLAFSEAAAADFVTCDDRLLRQCRRLPSTCWCGTPLALCEKENLR